ncbi:MAG: hypothetical protein OXC61_03075 [Flavobacteriaceae bacterium]|nr:hypothetical protein [Flavobacteriaceae bacterium]
MEQFQNIDSQLWSRLQSRCLYLLKKRYSVEWNLQKRQDFTREIISEVIIKIFDEKTRKWNLDRYPDFEDFILGVVDSHLNNTLKNNKHHRDESEDSVFMESDLGVEEDIMHRELRNEIYTALEEYKADDDELLIFECMAEGITKPKNIKQELGMTEKEFHNAWRRLSRKRKIIGNTIKKPKNKIGYEHK